MATPSHRFLPHQADKRVFLLADVQTSETVESVPLLGGGRAGSLVGFAADSEADSVARSLRQHVGSVRVEPELLAE